MNKDQKAEGLLRDILDLIGVESEVELSASDEFLEIRVSTEEAGLLIGRRGETLDSLQYLLNVMVNKGEEERRRIIVDVEGYRRERKKQLEESATRAAEEVAEKGLPVSLQPMNPFERRVVHMALVDHPGVETVSEGEEPYRAVRIIPGAPPAEAGLTGDSPEAEEPKAEAGPGGGAEPAAQAEDGDGTASGADPAPDRDGVGDTGAGSETSG